MDQLARWWHGFTTRRLFGASWTAFPLTELPLEVMGSMFGFLTGLDLLQLSRVNRHFFYGVLANDAEIWQRLPPLSPSSSTLLVRPPISRSTPSLKFRLSPKTEPLSPGTAKQRYCTCQSILFRGSRLDGLHTSGAIRTPRPEEISRAGSFSFNIVFALFPAFNATHTEGVLLGAQSSHDHRPAKQRLFVYTDANRNLYCSVMNDQPIIRERLRFDCWYYLTLVFETTAPGRATQRVYLDGELFHTADGWLCDDWAFLSHAQLGTGYATDGVLSRGDDGWYAFNGLVDECRFWDGALQPHQVQCLISGQSFDTPVTNVACKWSL